MPAHIFEKIQVSDNVSSFFTPTHNGKENKILKSKIGGGVIVTN